MAKVRELTVTGPFAVFLPRKTMADKKFAVNMNIYRNMHFQPQAQMKRIYTELLKEQLQGVTLEVPVNVTYKVFKPTKRRLDKMNVCSITSKFMLDAMSEFGVIPDDNDDYIKDELLLDSEKDKDYPRVEVTFKTVGD